MAKSLRSLHCESITIDIPFEASEIDRARFKGTALDPADDGWVREAANVSNNRWKEHGHLTLDSRDAEYGRLWISLHQGRVSKDGSSRTFEDLLFEVAKLFVGQSLVARSVSEFKFPRSYIPKVVLGYPALLDGHQDDESEVTGVELKYQGWPFTEKVFVRYVDDDLTVSAESYYSLDLATLDLHELAAEDAKAVSRVVLRKTK